jgi:uncharacterized phage protein (TIGR01671 family)
LHHEKFRGTNEAIGRRCRSVNDLVEENRKQEGIAGERPSAPLSNLWRMIVMSIPQREIKFRVWDKDLKKKHILGENEHDSIHFLNNQACYYNLQNGCGSLPKELGEGTYEIMQYTGLKDKNGVEIYEGDIVNFYHSEGKSYSKENAVVEYVQAWCGFYFAENIRLNSCQKIEVIGNIYENPSLLEESK